MKFLLDQGIGRLAVAHLATRRIEAVHVADVGLEGESDEHIVAHARSSDSVIVTLDADFNAIVALSGLAKPSVIRIRFEGLKSNAIAEIISGLAIDFADELATGCFVTFTEGDARVRTLPILRR